MKHSTENITDVFERITDAFFALDTNWRYTYMNKKAGEIFNCNPAIMIGKHIWTKIPEGIEQIFYSACQQAMSEQHYIHETHYYSPDKKWFEIHVYPSPEGLSVFFRDITAAKMGEDKLEESEKKLLQVLASTSDNFYVVDRAYNVILINETAKRNLEIAWEKPVDVGTNLLEVIPLQGGERILESFEKVFSGERIEYELYHSLETLPSWVLVNFTPVIDEADTVVGAHVVAKDITERKKAEQVIRESEERYRTLVENATEALVVLDTEKKNFITVSESAGLLFKMSKEELLKTGPIELSPEYQPDGRLSAEVALEKINEAIEGGKPYFEWTHCDSIGNLIPCELRLVRLPSENQILVRGSIIDITERKRTEQAIKSGEETRRLIMNSSLDAIICLDTAGKVTVWTQQAEKIFGWSEEEMTGKRISDTIIPQQYREQHREGLTNYRKTGDGIILNRLIEITALRKNQEEFPVELTIVPFEQDGKTFFCGFLRDITERKKGEELLKQTSEQLRQLTGYLQNIREEERITIAREIHDELGQQLTVMKMDISWLHNKLGVSDDIVRQRMKELNNILDETVVTVRRIASELRPSMLDDMGLVAAIEWQLSEFEKRFGVKTIFNKTNSEISLPADFKTGLFRIVQESLTNVSRYAKAKKVVISLQQVEGEIQLTIEDDGEGFDNEKIAAKKTLGILGMKERAAMMGGVYVISSMPGKGTIATTNVPFRVQ